MKKTEVKIGFVFACTLCALISGLCFVSESLSSSSKNEDILAHFVMVDFKDGTKGSGVLVKETPDAVFLSDPDGSAETSFPRDKIVAVRKPNAEELERLKEALSEMSN